MRTAIDYENRRTDWAPFADPTCLECRGSGECRVRDKHSVTVLCHCTRSWRPYVQAERTQRLLALGRYQAANKERAARNLAAILTLAAIAAVMMCGR